MQQNKWLIYIRLATLRSLLRQSVAQQSTVSSNQTQFFRISAQMSSWAATSSDSMKLLYLFPCCFYGCYHCDVRAIAFMKDWWLRHKTLLSEYMCLKQLTIRTPTESRRLRAHKRRLTGNQSKEATSALRPKTNPTPRWPAAWVVSSLEVRG